jgi:hypothetical protein
VFCFSHAAPYRALYGHYYLFGWLAAIAPEAVFESFPTSINNFDLLMIFITLVGLGIQDLSLCLSGCALLTLNAHFFFHRQCEQILQSSPLRTLRIGSGLLILILLILHPTHQLIRTSLHSNPNLDHPIGSSHYLFLPAEHLFIDPTPHTDPNSAADYSFFISISVLASVLAVAVCSGHLVVAAAGGLLQVVLTSSFTSSSAIRLILRAICSIVGSMCAVTGYSAVLGLR